MEELKVRGIFVGRNFDFVNGINSYYELIRMTEESMCQAVEKIEASYTENVEKYKTDYEGFVEFMKNPIYPEIPLLYYKSIYISIHSFFEIKLFELYKIVSEKYGDIINEKGKIETNPSIFDVKNYLKIKLINEDYEFYDISEQLFYHQILRNHIVHNDFMRVNSKNNKKINLLHNADTLYPHYCEQKKEIQMVKYSIPNSGIIFNYLYLIDAYFIKLYYV